jgi:hypothetical protein
MQNVIQNTKIQKTKYKNIIQNIKQNTKILYKM